MQYLRNLFIFVGHSLNSITNFDLFAKLILLLLYLYTILTTVLYYTKYLLVLVIIIIEMEFTSVQINK